MSEFYVNWAKVKFEVCIRSPSNDGLLGCIPSFVMPWKLRKRQKKFTCQSKSFISMFSFAKFKLVSCNLWQMTYTQSQTAKTVLATLNWSKVRPSRPFGFSLAWLLAFYEVVCVGCRSRSWFVLYAPGARGETSEASHLWFPCSVRVVSPGTRWSIHTESRHSLKSYLRY